MRVDRGTLLPVNPGATPVSLTDFTVLRDDRSQQLLVLRVPDPVFDGTDLADQPGTEAGAPITLTVAPNTAYEGFVEVVAQAVDSRVYWCGAAET